MAIYEKPVRLLMRELVRSLELKQGDEISKSQVLEWFATRYPKIKQGTVSAHLVLLSTNDRGRIYHKPHLNGEDDLLYKKNSGLYRLYERGNDPMPIYRASAAGLEEGLEPENDLSSQTSQISESVRSATNEFAFEHDLRDYLARNLHLIEPGLHVYQEEGITGIEFPAGGRYIDILAVDAKGQYVVIELKVSRGYDRVVGQLLRYMAWIEKNQADPEQGVRGVIVAREISDDLSLACSKLTDVRLYAYHLSVTLTEATC